jgi:hypothetical protein
MKKLTQRGHRLAIGAAGIALILAPLTAVMGAAPAAAAPAAQSVSCIRTGFLPTSINGVTYNQSNVALTRTFTEKGVTNSWHPEPAARIERPSEGRTATTDQWCVNAQFGSAMKVGYKTPDGTTVTFAADQYVLQSPNASCSVSGPSAGQLTCGTHISKSTYDDSYATFVVAGKGDVGSPPPPETTISCASLQDRGRDGGLVTGDLCSGVVGFNGTARLKGFDRDDGERSYDCAEVRVTLERSADGSTYRAARGTRCQLV